MTKTDELARSAAHALSSLDHRLDNAKDTRGAMLAWADTLLTCAGVPDQKRDAFIDELAKQAGYEWTHTRMGAVVLAKKEQTR